MPGMGAEAAHSTTSSSHFGGGYLNARKDEFQESPFSQEIRDSSSFRPQRVPIAIMRTADLQRLMIIVLTFRWLIKTSRGSAATCRLLRFGSLKNVTSGYT